MISVISTPSMRKEKGNAANVAFGNQINHWLGFSFDFSRCRCLSCFSTDFGSTCSGFFSSSDGGEPLDSFTMRQSAESTLDFLRCRRSSSSCAMLTIARMSVPALSPISSILASVSSALFSSSCKLSGPVAVTCRRATSLRIAVTINPALLSSDLFNASMLSITSCGMRIDICFDLSLTVFLTMSVYLIIWCDSVYTKNESQKDLTCDSLETNLNHTSLLWCDSQRQRPGVLGTTTEASNHNVSWSNIMACSHDTQTRPEFTYLFLGTPSDKPNTTPVVLRAEANNEQQARAHFLNWNLVFAAQIRTKAPCRLQLMDGGSHFTWIFEQRFDACTSGVQEVAHV